MTPKIIELKQAPVVLVEKPNEDDNDLVVVSGKEIFYNGDYFELPKADFRNPWRVLGILSDLTEEQFSEFAIKMTWGGDAGIYADHTNPSTSVKMSAKESVYSMLKSENVYTENSYGGKPEPCGCMGPCGIPCAFNEWQEAQSRTIDPTRTVVLLRKEEA